MEIEDVRPEIKRSPTTVAEYILRCHDGDAAAAVEVMQEEIEHLQQQLSIAVAAMGRGYTRGWKPGIERE